MSRRTVRVKRVVQARTLGGSSIAVSFRGTTCCHCSLPGCHWLAPEGPSQFGEAAGKRGVGREGAPRHACVLQTSVMEGGESEQGRGKTLQRGRGIGRTGRREEGRKGRRGRGGGGGGERRGGRQERGRRGRGRRGRGNMKCIVPVYTSSCTCSCHENLQPSN